MAAKSEEEIDQLLKKCAKLFTPKKETPTSPAGSDLAFHKLGSPAPVPVDLRETMKKEVDRGAKTQIHMSARKKIGRYELIRLLGVGGMGEVYQAEDTALHRTVALKVLSPQAAANQDGLRRFRREAKSSAKLTHPNIVAVYDFEECDHVHFLTMQYVDGKPLDQLMSKNILPLRKSLAIILKILGGVDHAHKRGIMHRDIKPSNILVTKDQVFITDFGLAKAMHDETTQISVAGQILGTLSYMSPEQARGDVENPPDQRADVYSVGVILYEMVTGKRPTAGDTPMAILYNLANTPISPPSQIRTIPARLEQIILKSLEKERENRYQSAEAMAKDLRLFLQHFRPASRTTGVGVFPVKQTNSGLPKVTLPKVDKKQVMIWLNVASVLFIAIFAAWLFPKKNNNTVADSSDISLIGVEETEEMQPMSTIGGGSGLGSANKEEQRHDPFTDTPGLASLSSSESKITKVTKIKEEKLPKDSLKLAAVENPSYQIKQKPKSEKKQGEGKKSPKKEKKREKKKEKRGNKEHTAKKHPHKNGWERRNPNEETHMQRNHPRMGRRGRHNAPRRKERMERMVHGFFAKADKNGNLMLSSDEITSEQIAKLDQDNDNQVTISEATAFFQNNPKLLKKLVEERKKHLAKQRNQQRRLSPYLSNVDYNKDGKISRQEWTRAKRNPIGFNVLDKNQDKVIDFKDQRP